MWAHLRSSRLHSQFCSLPYFWGQTPALSPHKKNNTKTSIMPKPTPPQPSPNFSPACNMITTDSLNSAFHAMILRPPIVSPDNFDNNWGATDTEQALMASGIDNARLKECIVAASALVWGVPPMRPAQLEACYRLLHPHCPNYLVVVHRTGGGEDTHTPNSWGYRVRHHLNIYSAAHALGGCDAQIRRCSYDLG